MYEKQITIGSGVPILSPNRIMQGDGFYISYCNGSDTSIYGSDTTALVLGQMQKFYILNGDHRLPYALLVTQGFEACLSYFKAHIGEANRYSDKLAT